MTTRVKIIKEDLEELLEYTETEEPKLYQRLSEIWRWIKKKKDGLILSKRHVLNFLEEIIEDSFYWLNYQTLSLEDKEKAEKQLTPSRYYWSLVLFPLWFRESDPKLGIWKQKLMRNEYKHLDNKDIQDTCNAIENEGGNTHTGYILDLSMATDLVAATACSTSLAVQLTTMSKQQLLTQKKNKWKQTLQYWNINRGLLVSYNPKNDAGFRATHILRECRYLQSSYKSITL